MTSLQPALPNVPVAGATPQPYISVADATQRLQSEWAIELPIPVGNGQLRVASMRADQEGPFFGVKIDPEQEHEWPRTFKYGWPNIIAAPTPMLVSVQFPGAWYLDYEGVVPVQIVDWVCLEVYRMTALPFDRGIVSETVTGASVHYAPPVGQKGGIASELDEIQAGLLSPFQLRQGHTSPFANFGAL